MIDILEELISITREIGKALLELQSGDLQLGYKGKAELVTNADKLSHDMMLERFAKVFPGLPLILEEQENVSELPQKFLVGDELDGTAPYSKGLSDWGISLAYVDHEPTHGVIFLPARNMLIAAEKGKGCWINDEQINLDVNSKLSDSIWIAEINRYLSEKHHGLIRNLTEETLATRSLACATASIAEILSGHANLYINCIGGKIWDFAAGALAVREAGGVVCDIDGKEILWDSIPMSIVLSAGKSIQQEVSKHIFPKQ